MSLFKLLLSTCLLFIIATSCNFNRTYLNREEDKNDAEKVVDQFYKRIELGKYDDVDSLFSSEFWKVTTKEKLHKLLAKTNEKLGKVKNKNLAKWETKKVEGSNPLSIYALLYENKYNKFESKESFRLIREKDKIKIISFNINSDAFIQ